MHVSIISMRLVLALAAQAAEERLLQLVVVRLRVLL